MPDGDNVFDWSTTPAGNAFTAPQGFPENMDPDAVNDSARQLFATIAKWLREDAPWMEFTRGETLTKLSDTEIRIESAGPTDYSAYFGVGRQVKIVGASTVYARVTAVAFSSPNTDVTVEVDGGSAVPGALTELHASILDVESGVALLSTLAPSATFEPERGANLIRDASFFDGNFDRWGTDAGGGAWSINSSNQRSGANCAEFDALNQVSTAHISANSQDETDRQGHLTIQDGMALYLSCFVRWLNTDPGVAKVRFAVRTYSADGALLSQLSSVAFEPNATYTKHEFVAYPMPEDTAYAVPVIEILSGSPATTHYLFDDFFAKLVALDTVLPTIASDTQITIPSDVNAFFISGSATIEYINSLPAVVPAWPGRIITLIGDPDGAGWTLEDGVLVALQNEEDFVGGPGDTITLISGEEFQPVPINAWYELARTHHVTPGFTIPTIASASSIALPSNTIRAIYLSGSTQVNTITATVEGHVVTVINTATAQLMDATGNLRLAGNGPNTLDDSVTLICDGANWIEIGRTGNV